MNLLEYTLTDHIMLQADWQCEKAVLLLEALHPSHVIIHRLYQGSNLFYLYTTAEMLERLKDAPATKSISLKK